MVHIAIKKGLNIPIQGEPIGQVQNLTLEGLKEVALDLTPFEDVKLKLLTEVGHHVKIGQPIAEDKSSPGRNFVAPASGIIKEIRRGLKRRLLAIVIEVDQNPEYLNYEPIPINEASRNSIVSRLNESGLFTKIRQRPFGLLADPTKVPRSIFIKAVESAPYTPSAEMQVEGHEKAFQIGLDTLAKLTDGKCHLVYHKDTTSDAFINAKHVEKHQVEGPHPVSHPSLHIQRIDPIQSSEDVIWTLNVNDVIGIGEMISKGRYFHQKVIGIGGPHVIEGKTGFYRVQEGIHVSHLINGRLRNENTRLISGNPLMGHQVEGQDFLGFYDFAFSMIPENESREFLHFFRLGKDKYSMSRAYLSGHLSDKNRKYDFTTNQHGEQRPFIVASLYDKVQPLNISTMLLTKAVMAEDFDLAEELGLLEVVPEDFALPTFVCPSKMEMVEIIERGLKLHAKEVLS